ncbi:MAG: hypothetical protein DCC68_25110 [Planctomycetota bacterium]|nr:MAG: hypothetical protein DCC68_25110 [Planctomycetota bacterium]
MPEYARSAVFLIAASIAVGCTVDTGSFAASGDAGQGDEISAAVSEAIAVFISEVEERQGGHVTREVGTKITPRKISITVELAWVDVKKLPLETKRIARASVKRDVRGGKWEAVQIAEVDGEDGGMLKERICEALAKREVPIK